MPAPTIASVTPDEGHTGGKTLVEVAGTGFRLPPDSPPFGPAPAPPPTVRVTFGGQAATDVQVWSTTKLYCLTPDYDERLVETSWASVDPVTDVFSAPAHGLADGTVVRLVETSGRLPPPLQPEVAYYVVGAAANTFKLSATSSGPPVDVTAAAPGKAVSVGAYDVVVENLDAAGVPIPGESVTAPAAYTFRRPDLGQEGELARVVRAMLRLLKRQVHPNVSFTTHTDYDPTTGDTLNLAYTQRLPALVLANLEVPDDPEYRIEYDEDVQVGSDRFVERRPPAVVQVKYDLVGVTDDPVELLNLVEAARTCFRKTPRLKVDRRADDPSAGHVEYDLEYRFVGPAAAAQQGDNSNVGSFAAEVRVRGVLLGDVPGVTAKRLPGMPDGMPHEATRRFGYTTVDSEGAVELQAQDV